MENVKQFIDFVAHSATAFQAVDTMTQFLKEAGYTQLLEHEAWNIAPGGRYFVTRNRSAVIAFAVPEHGCSHFQIVSSHSDSPTFKLKPNAESESCGQYVRLNVEPYGGMIMSTWLDRPLSIAGRVMVRENNRLVTRLVDLDRETVVIPNMPIHFNRSVNSGYAFNPQVDLLPLYGGKDAKGKLMEEVAASVGAKAEDIAAHDLFLYCRTPGTVWGAENEFFSCPRIDDLECAFTSFKAFLDAETKDHVNVCALFDNEEVGSGTKQGADSTFLEDVLMRTASALGLDDAAARAAFSASFMVSADNAHALHPNHPEKFDEQNRTLMNGGVVIKHNANQKYTTDAVSEAIFAEVCRKAGVPVQHFSNRSDVAGGSTLGNIANAHVSLNTVDIGLAQLAMHSSYETAGVEDVDHMINALRAFFSTNIVTYTDGDYSL